MLDIKNLRDNFEEVKKALNKKNVNIDFDLFLDMDSKRRAFIQEVEVLKNQRNTSSKEIPALKKEGKDTTALMEEMKKLSDTIKDIEPKIKKLDDDIREFLLGVPNTPHSSVVEGNSDEDNVELRKVGEIPTFDFTPKPHWDLGINHDILDFERGVKITGSRFTLYKGLGARLERAVINFMLDTHLKNGYVEVLPPVLANSDSLTGTGNLPKFADDMFKINNTDYYLIPTAEVPVTNIYRGEILSGDDLTISHCAFTPCFRSEAGSAGRDTRGLIRQHQFNKVELVKFTKPEDSYQELENLTANAESILKALKLPYRVVALCGGDLTFSSAKTYDIEVWLPSYEKYVEISSCSNFEDYQARRANIKYKNDKKDKPKYVHTLNGSGLAAGRTVAAILENYQREDGKIVVPDVLVPYLQGETIIG